MRRILAVTAVLTLLGGTSACGAIGNVQRVAKAANELAHGNKQLNAFIDRAKKAQSAVYVAEYKTSGSSGGAVGSAFRIAQKPPKSVFRSSEGNDQTTVVNDGADTFTCSGTPVQCLKAAGTGQFSTAAFANYLNPASFIQLLAPLATLANFSIGTSSRDIAGQHSECVTLTNNNKDAGADRQATYCTTDNGIFSFASDHNGTVEMTKYSTTVGESEFKLPGKVVDPTLPTDTTTSTTSNTSTTSSFDDTTTTSSVDSTTTSVPSDATTPSSTDDTSTTDTTTTGA